MMGFSMAYPTKNADEIFTMEFHGQLVMYGEEELFYQQENELDYNPLTVVDMVWSASDEAPKDMFKTDVTHSTTGLKLYTDTRLGKTKAVEEEQRPVRTETVKK